MYRDSIKQKINTWKKEIIIVGLIIIIQTIIFIVAGINKLYIHMDEAYSLGLASYDKVEIQSNEDFYNIWHTKKYYEDYLTINEDEQFKFSQVYDNQKNDVHPPLYYLLLRIAMGFNIGTYSKWTGIILNVVIYAFITIFTYLISRKLLEGKKQHKEKSAIITLVSSITLSAVTNAIYIRMYALSTLNIVIITYLHLKLLEEREKNNKLLIMIGISALVGSLTHYYYLFYLVALFIMFVIKYIKEKEYKQLGKYIGTMIIAGITSLIIFPYSIQHMFFGYRGQGAIDNLTNISKFISSIFQYIMIINIYGFNNILLILIIGVVCITIYKKIKKKPIIENKNRYIKYILIPTLVYFILVSISSPWITLRYVMPICGILFILAIYYIDKLLSNIIKEKTTNIIFVSMFLMMLIMPIISNEIINLIVGKEFMNEQEYLYSNKTEIVENMKRELKIPIEVIYRFTDASDDNILFFIKNLKLEPEVLYSNKKYIVEKIKDDLNVPALYLFNSNNNRFLDDILLFAYIDKSYIAKDIECTDEKIKEIMKNQDISNGILIFINEGQENENLLNIIQKSVGLYNITYLQRLNACDVYYIK
jgi:hypothetical protein